jgi:hypothetical protein
VLRVAIGLDRRHERRVAAVRAAADGGTLVIRALAADGADISLEVFAAGERKALLERVLDCDVEVVAG